MNILGSLSRKKCPELEWVSWVIKDYNLHNQSKLSETTRTPIPRTHHKKKKLTSLLVSPLSLLPLVLPVVSMNRLSISNENKH